jgi:hypothetical protein
MGYGGPYYEHAYSATVDIESPTQNWAYDYDSQGWTPYGGGSADAYDSISYLDDPGIYEARMIIQISCSWIGQLLRLEEFVADSLAVIDINRHTSVTLSATDVDFSIFPAATLVLVNDDGTGDVNCPIIFLRNGPISSFSTTDGSIDSALERDQVVNVPGRAKVVSEINYCTSPPPPGVTIWGCSAPISMIVRRATPSLEGILWAHEFGHNQDLWLFGHGSDPNFLSYSNLVSTAKRVTQSECTTMRF